MSINSKIEWTEATWNPLLGCSKIAPGCKNCYAIRQVWRMAHNPNPKIAAACAGLVQIDGGKLNWTGRINTLPKRLAEPTRRRKPTTYFVNSLSDLFHDDVPRDFIQTALNVMLSCRQHRFIVLTKRFGRAANESKAWMEMLGFTRAIKRPPNNIILGFSASDQKTFDEGWASFSFLAATGWTTAVSLEPLLGPVNILPHDGRFRPDEPKPGWVIVGGESGPGARPMHPDWPRSLRDQCKRAGVPFFFKQHGQWQGVDQATSGVSKTVTEHLFADGTICFRLGKKESGRLLDGRTWDEVPEALCR